MLGGVPAHLRCTQVFYLVAPYGYLLSDMYFVYGRYHKSRLSCLELSDPGLVLDITRFCEQQRHPFQRVRMAGMPKKTVSRTPICWGQGGSTQFAQQLEFAVTAPPLVGCVVWSHYYMCYPILLIWMLP